MVTSSLEERRFAGAEDQPAENYKFHASNMNLFFGKQGSDRKSFDWETALSHWYLTVDKFYFI